MYKNAFSLIVFILGSLKALSNPYSSSKITDTTLKEVVVTAFNNGQRWKDAPAAVAVLQTKELNTYSPVSMVPVMNTLPGVRMEERSPGSYRFSIRGSLLRSPFGVRNVKVYWNEIPISDATGNTYLNLLDLQQVSKVEIAKGPSASTYGAGTGGVVLFNRFLPLSDSTLNSFTGLFSAGSFGLQQAMAEWKYSTAQFGSILQISDIRSNGYRDQSALNKTTISWQTTNKLKQQEFNTLFFYTNLKYQTPGAITKAQMLLNPTLSRQAAGSFPSAIQQKTAVYNQTIFGAVKHTYHLNDQLYSKSFLSINHTQFNNPFITNFEQRNEVNMNAGVQFVFTPFQSLSQLQWINGVEWLFNESAINNYTNKAGFASAIISQDMVFSKQQFYFSQLQLQFNRFSITAGFSNNVQTYQYKRLIDLNASFNRKKIQAPWIPRLSTLYKLNKNVSAYAIVAAGFSAPSLAEVRPSDGNFYPLLNAEKGWNTEIGLKGFLFENKLAFDLAYYRFKLNEAIVRRNDAAGNEYFVNAGATLQQGIELYTKFSIINNQQQPIKSFTISYAYSFQPYQFVTYKQGSIDYSGNKLTGVPRSTNMIQATVSTHNNYYLNLGLQLTSAIPLNDGNTEMTDPYQLLQLRIGRTFKIRRSPVEIFAGGDNLLNQLYSLGNDINAAGGRYYNPASTRNWYTGIRISFND